MDRYIWNIAKGYCDNVPIEKSKEAIDTNRIFSNLSLKNGTQIITKHNNRHLKFDIYDVFFIKETMGKFDSRHEIAKFCKKYCNVSEQTIGKIINSLNEGIFDEIFQEYLKYEPEYKFKWERDFLLIDFGDGIWMNSCVRKKELYEIIQCSANKNTREEKMDYSKKLQNTGSYKLTPRIANFLVFNYNNKELCHMAKSGII